MRHCWLLRTSAAAAASSHPRRQLRGTPLQRMQMLPAATWTMPATPPPLPLAAPHTCAPMPVRGIALPPARTLQPLPPLLSPSPCPPCPRADWLNDLTQLCVAAPHALACTLWRHCKARGSLRSLPARSSQHELRHPASPARSRPALPRRAARPAESTAPPPPWRPPPAATCRRRRGARRGPSCVRQPRGWRSAPALARSPTWCPPLSSRMAST